MKENQFATIVLAAGQGKRMASPLPKVLHPVAGVPMIKRVIDAVKGAGSTEVRVVVGYSEALVRRVIEPMGVVCFKQAQQLGTGDAVRSAQVESLEGDVLIMNGDHPLIETADIEKLRKDFKTQNCDLAVVTAKVKNPGSLGRIVRHRGELKAIVEAADASHETLKIKEVNTGIYLVKAKILQKFLPLLTSNNAQKEYYLTEILTLAQAQGAKVTALEAHLRVAFGVNSQQELAKATRVLFKKRAVSLMDRGVVMIDPNTTYVDAEVQVGQGTVIYPNVHLKGKTSVGSFSVIEPNCFIVNSKIGDSVQVRSGSYFEQAEVSQGAVVGPYARLRPETFIGAEAQIGNFVELKNVVFGAKAKANHLSYLGDAEVGEGSNIGCGTITCNYAVDRKKYRTVIGKNVFVGSDSQLVAPVTVGDNAIIGSGSTITKDVPENALAVARSKQFTKENYALALVEKMSSAEAEKKEI